MPDVGDVYLVSPNETVVLIGRHKDFFYCARINPFFEEVKPFDLLLEGEDWSFSFRTLLESWNVVPIHIEDFEGMGSKCIGSVVLSVVARAALLYVSSQTDGKIPSHLQEFTGKPYTEDDPRWVEHYATAAAMEEVRRYYHERR